MRKQDRMVFAAAAKELRVWILVRETNKASLEFIGKPGFTPKPLECKAKTADAPHQKCAGLVVDPHHRPGAFTAGRLAAAKAEWLNFLPVLQRDPSWKVFHKAGHEFDGCVTFQGKYVHADYDLKDVIPIDHFERNLALVVMSLNGPAGWGPQVRQVQHYVNVRLGVPMIQHGAEVQYKDLSGDAVIVFAPDGRSTAEFETAAALKAWYQLNGRRILDLSKPGPPGKAGWLPRVIPGGKP